jgi:hypothetical protein
VERKVFLSFGEQIYHTLKERILSNYYAPGAMLQIEKLAIEDVCFRKNILGG